MVSSGDLQATSGRTDGGWRASRDVCRHVRLTRRGLITAVYSAVLTSTDASWAVIAVALVCPWTAAAGRRAHTHVAETAGPGKAESWRIRDAKTRRGDASTETRARRLGQSRRRREVETGGPHSGVGGGEGRRGGERASGSRLAHGLRLAE